LAVLTVKVAQTAVCIKQIAIRSYRLNQEALPLIIGGKGHVQIRLQPG
jgi:hypothetical protein